MAQDTPKKKRHLGIILRTAVAIVALSLIFLFGDWDWQRLGQAFRTLSPVSLAIAVVGFMAATVVIGLRWYALIRTQKIEVKPWTCIKITFLGVFYNNVLVSSVGGELLRLWYITHHTSKRVEAIFSVLVDRLIGLLVLIVLALGMYWLVPVSGQEGAIHLESRLDLLGLLEKYWPIGLALVGVAATVLGAAFVIGRTRRIVLHVAEVGWAKIRRVLHAMRLYLHNPAVLLLVAVLSAVAQVLTILGFWAVGLSLEIPVSLRYYFVFFPLAWMIGAVPISIGGAGVLEGGVVFLFTLLPGVEVEQALVLALCQRIAFVLGGLPGVLVHVTGAHLPGRDALEREFSIDSDEARR